jgi:hypothetical protein
MTEEIEVRLRNQKRERVEVLVKENLYRWVNWTISSKSHDYRKDDARTIVFRSALPPTRKPWCYSAVGALSLWPCALAGAGVGSGYNRRSPPPRGSSKLLIPLDSADPVNPCFELYESRREPVDRRTPGGLLLLGTALLGSRRAARQRRRRGPRWSASSSPRRRAAK